ncbi:unnamed protein product [Bursaphelenchus okinawaensis]|uniref:Uncharacterized protein n=1 Tax=Bursaphelenchus okinawaensis TaxID=465554 RepID=A0A811KEN6_9BILA|nr:unnamed protein product [Bursaphelenchus okinawaensis]CAG9101828.1 unnamed protein product [Bursaphelenchus okinawaensis]
MLCTNLLKPTSSLSQASSSINLQAGDHSLPHPQFRCQPQPGLQSQGRSEPQCRNCSTNNSRDVATNLSVKQTDPTTIEDVIDTQPGSKSHENLPSYIRAGPSWRNIEAIDLDDAATSLTRTTTSSNNAIQYSLTLKWAK